MLSKYFQGCYEKLLIIICDHIHNHIIIIDTFITPNHLGPVVGDLWQIEVLTDVDQVEDVLLEARAAEAHAGGKVKEGRVKETET